jgi:prenyltransferase beta subunit
MLTLFDSLSTALRSGIVALGDDRRAALLRQFDLEAEWGLDRAGQPDLYYTVFTRMIRHALDLTPHNQRLPNSPGNSDEMDLVHLGSWIRIRRIGPAHIFSPDSNTNLPAIDRFRRPDGGYALTPGGESLVTASYLALNACQDLGSNPPETDSLEHFLSTHREGDGFVNSGTWPRAILPATAAATHLLSAVREQPPESALNWIAHCAKDSGGFGLFPQSPFPDPLATGVALFTLKTFDFPIDRVEEHRDYILSLWRDTGGFVGDSTDSKIDGEYTFYGLLGLAGCGPGENV